MMRFADAEIAIVALTITLSGCVRSGVGTRVRMALTGSPGGMMYLPHTIAQELGFYRQQGLETAVEDVNGGSRRMQALLGGSADVVIGHYEHSIRVAAQGRRVRSFVAMTRYPGNVIIVSPATKKRIEAIKDLKGALVRVPDPSSSSQAHLFLNFLLVRNGLSPARRRSRWVRRPSDLRYGRVSGHGPVFNGGLAEQKSRCGSAAGSQYSAFASVDACALTRADRSADTPAVPR